MVGLGRWPRAPQFKQKDTPNQKDPYSWLIPGDRKVTACCVAKWSDREDKYTNSFGGATE